MQKDKADLFIRKKKEECERLIQLHIWDGIDSNSLRAWMKNFSSTEEKFFAACILDWLVYRNDKHVLSMIHDLFTKHLHNQWRLDKNPLYSEDNNPLILLKNKWNEINFRYVTAVTKIDKDTKSGYHIISQMNHKMGISSKWNIKCAEIPEFYNKGIRTFVFVDDIIGTGEQMKTILKEANIEEYEDIYVYVLVCAGHETGLNELKKEFPKVRVLCAEFIPNNSNFFEQIPKDEFEKTSIDEMRQWYVEFMRSKNVSNDNILGRGNLGLLYAFQNNVPNDSLPILYYKNEKLDNLLNKRG